MAPALTRYESQGVTLLGDQGRPGGVTFAFTERTGGVSVAPYDSLNLGDAVGDDSVAVRENRLRALRALGAEGVADSLVCPLQVHGSRVVTVGASSDEAIAAAQEEARSGADAIVCVVPDVPAMICTADCLPLVLVCDGAFAVVHSGRAGTMERIGVRALEALCEASGCKPEDVTCYLGPCIQAEDYEVSKDLAHVFAEAFGSEALVGERNLDLVHAVICSLIEAGVPEDSIFASDISTARTQDRFFSYRASGGTCGRQGVLAWIDGREGR